ncbi:unnamed protein product [Soboliphyme baturini]|uniref:BHLH domain-containing protein n=1 Tax=Soboliphyme baturini TaxID=241478 RepID=A0A183J2Y6_9BILA|nr:unnamed protein product [Soboliphyme baturini]
MDNSRCFGHIALVNVSPPEKNFRTVNQANDAQQLSSSTLNYSHLAPLSGEEEEKRSVVVEHRNARERRRVHTVNEAFTHLKRHLPSLKQKKRRVSKLKILRSAIEYIHDLQATLATSRVAERTFLSVVHSGYKQQRDDESRSSIAVANQALFASAENQVFLQKAAQSASAEASNLVSDQSSVLRPYTTMPFYGKKNPFCALSCEHYTNYSDLQIYGIGKMVTTPMHNH